LDLNEEKGRIPSWAGRLEPDNSKNKFTEEKKEEVLGDEERTLIRDDDESPRSGKRKISGELEKKRGKGRKLKHL